MRVLIADDSNLILDRLQNMLCMCKGAEIVGLLKNGKETLDAINLLKPDLAIIDINMPGINGLEVLNAVKKVNNEIKIIILTFYTSDYYRQIAFKSGTDYFFSKVDDFDKIPDVVNSLLRLEEKNGILKN
jgi:DNA-binding NarL/FixJ family response regulator